MAQNYTPIKKSQEKRKKIDKRQNLVKLAAMKDRYSVGFKEDDVKCDILEVYPELFPVVDYRFFGYGQVIAFALTQYEASELVWKLQLLEDYKDRGFPVEK